MNNSVDPKNPTELQIIGQLPEEKGLYVREDDQDWGSSGMNDIQKDTE